MNQDKFWIGSLLTGSLSVSFTAGFLDLSRPTIKQPADCMKKVTRCELKTGCACKLRASAINSPLRRLIINKAIVFN